MKWMKLLPAALAVACLATVAHAEEKGLDNHVKRDPYYEGLKGKKVVFVPLAMGFDLTEGWAAIMRKQAADLGYSFEIRDPNWSTDAGTRAITSIIAEKPDLAIIHNPDLQSYARLEQRMVQAGIKVLQVNLEATVPTDYYVGADWVKVGLIEAEALVKKCGTGSGTSGKVAILEGQPTAASNLYELYAYYHVFGQDPAIKIVADQAATYDPAKARAITETVLQQHPDLCGIVGNWDNQDVGAGAAVAAAGKSDQVYIVTSGGGSKTGCDNIEKGLLDLIVSYDVPLQGDALNQAIVQLLLSPAKAGEIKSTYFTPLTLQTKDTISPRSCWTLDQLK
ncbi:sugar ABC transporter substrate-binding protein [Mesorhizobium sp. BR1-1-16]|uniref:sugar ABC transporter substrate-binding protein n=1 Tax=Mesorhizobium sp. BR1-1-16 TaxID=2876653 RepID=UPI001CCC5067|nr:sugar ABC transporter substrate-binding protein [Mesorhizobium sp. BR1-1-16]MBZ9936865.1 sugar ABC transporter substrate-binding protein [Mesorhizobium sp. BR1-1-16]